MSFLENFHYQVTGPENAPKLVFLHGVMGFGANWRTVAKAFETHYQCLAFDQRGHGRSMKPETGYEPENYADDLVKILDELKWDKINLVGHSMGGRNALSFANLYPDRVERLVIEDIGPTINQAGKDFIAKLLDTVPVPFATRRDAKVYFETEFQQVFSWIRNPVGLGAYLNANIIEDDAKRGVWRFYEPGIRQSLEATRTEDRWDEIRKLTMPTLLVRGEHSNDLPRDIFDKVLRENPAIEGVEIAGAGHWVHSDQPQAFIAALERFLAST